MDSLSGISMFVLVAETRSFTKAGQQLGVSSSAVGKSIARMEERLAVRLFHRSTRSINLTAEGTLFLERCRRILGEVEAAEAELSEVTEAPRGRLRVSTPQLTGMMMPVLDAFMKEYPDIALDVDLSERLVDVIEDGFDAVVRTGEPNDSRLTARRLGSCRQVMVATPAYLAQRGVPHHPRDLAQHSCVLHKFPTTGKLEPWPFLLDEDEPEPILPERLTCNSTEAIIYGAKHGKGIALLPTCTVHSELASGQLVIVLDEFIDKVVTFWILWPASRYASPKLRVFIDFMQQNLTF